MGGNSIMTFVRPIHTIKHLTILYCTLDWKKGNFSSIGLPGREGEKIVQTVHKFSLNSTTYNLLHSVVQKMVTETTKALWFRLPCHLTHTTFVFLPEVHLFWAAYLLKHVHRLFRKDFGLILLIKQQCSTFKKTS